MKENIKIGKEYGLDGELKYKGKYLNDNNWNGNVDNINNNIINELKD